MIDKFDSRLNDNMSNTGNVEWLYKGEVWRERNAKESNYEGGDAEISIIDEKHSAENSLRLTCEVFEIFMNSNGAYRNCLQHIARFLILTSLFGETSDQNNPP